ncbi:GD19178 [Drosophila simulans]|uniref:GD19178 n=1 Tax=Drosophila simulans TaxID=7240 RepID=B4QV57_DROSI|nr:GD19178 [Drosophila simulans]
MFTSRGNGTGPLSAGLTLKWFRAIGCPWLADCSHLLLLNLLPLDPQFAGCLRDSEFWGLAADLDKDSAALRSI